MSARDTAPEPQEQDQQPGLETEMHPRPEADHGRPGSGRLAGRRVLITGGDSGIGRAVAVAFAREGANLHLSYLPSEEEDARETARLAEDEGATVLRTPGDIGDEAMCRRLVEATVEGLGGLDVLVLNAAEQHPQDRPEAITAEQVERTFRTNVFSAFHFLRAALPHLGEGSSIIVTTSVTAYKGSPVLIDYSATKGALVGLIRALSQAVADRGIRVNGVAPGPIWTPLIPATFDAESVGSFGTDVPLGRPGQPSEVAPAYVFLASDDGSYFTGQVLHPNGGTVVNA